MAPPPPPPPPPPPSQILHQLKPTSTTPIATPTAQLRHPATARRTDTSAAAAASASPASGQSLSSSRSFSSPPSPPPLSTCFTTPTALCSPSPPSKYHLSTSPPHLPTTPPTSPPKSTSLSLRKTPTKGSYLSMIRCQSPYYLAQ